ncbi:MAG: fibronectin type III domain-containing protein, partial [Firmicutes bacterium]|nr:fibronectin type III domain-containing protein [Bacillota bacterium]
MTSLERLRLGDWGGHPSRVISVEFRAKAVGTESNPDAPVYVKTVSIVAPSAEVDVELTLPAGAYTVQAKASHWLRGEDVVLTSVPWIFAAPTGANKVTVYWDEVPGATGYRVRWGTASGVYPNVSSVQSGDARMLSVTGLTSEQEYYFVVEAERNGVWSAPSEEDSAVPHVGAIPWDTGDAASILRAVR